MNPLKYNMCSISTLYIDREQHETFGALHLPEKSDYIQKKTRKKPTSLYKSNSSLAQLKIEKTFISLYRNMNYDSAKIKFCYILFRFELYSRIEKITIKIAFPRIHK